MISKAEIILKNNVLNKSKRTTAPGIEAKNEKGKILFSSLKIWISKIPFGEGKEIVPYPKTSLIKKNTSAKTQKKLHFTKTFFSSKRTDKLEEEYKFPRMKDVKAGIKISELLKKNLQNGISYVLIDGVNIEVSRLVQFIQKIQKNSKTENEALQLQIEKYIPGNVKLKNIRINYEQNNISAILNVKKICW